MWIYLPFLIGCLFGLAYWKPSLVDYIDPGSEDDTSISNYQHKKKTNNVTREKIGRELSEDQSRIRSSIQKPKKAKHRQTQQAMTRQQKKKEVVSVLGSPLTTHIASNSNIYSHTDRNTNTSSTLAIPIRYEKTPGSTNDPQSGSRKLAITSIGKGPASVIPSLITEIAPEPGRGDEDDDSDFTLVTSARQRRSKSSYHASTTGPPIVGQASGPTATSATPSTSICNSGSLPTTAPHPKLQAELWEYTYIDTQDGLQKLTDRIGSLSRSATPSNLFQLYLDTEGQDLGTSQGSLSLIQIGIPIPPFSYSFSSSAGRALKPPTAAVHVEVYLIDVIGLHGRFHLLADILEDPQLIKIVWDGRMDVAQIKHSHGIEIKGVLDFSMVELVKRMKEQENSVREGWVWGLMGMQKAVEKYQALEGDLLQKSIEIHREVRAKFTESTFHEWTARPLSSDLRAYSSSDIYKLSGLHAKFHHLGMLHPLPRLMSLSARFVSLHGDSLREAGNKYHQHGFLPAEVVEDGVGPRRICPGCERSLCASSYGNSVGSVFCRTCWRVETRGLRALRDPMINEVG
ncbi:Ribonuclease H-like domain [Phaffia rhodozyma]|uniref:Ribonuclease H-like domain n=1 Tax=Phaffia rhodozyma TaxID=264483 RepID=A0A0F7SUW3_PHARH|nr:Ribonuclease H-like domain [Phaffia rhodozyma]